MVSVTAGCCHHDSLMHEDRDACRPGPARALPVKWPLKILGLAFPEPVPELIAAKTNTRASALVLL